MYTTFWEWAREQNPEPFVVPRDAPGVAPGCRLILGDNFQVKDNPLPWIKSGGIHIHAVLVTEGSDFQLNVLVQRGIVYENTNSFWRCLKTISVLDLITVHLMKEDLRCKFLDDRDTDNENRKIVFRDVSHIVYPEVTHKLLHVIPENEWVYKMWYYAQESTVSLEKIPNWILL